ncbi:MAG: heavy-metal-associated domain-containing protein [Proteobacteria bacterium]|nr:heavy-metal-associated domain-containing protein [Pseudomonadota bacterium]
MSVRKGSMMRCFFKVLAVSGILACVLWGSGNTPSFADTLKSTTFQVQGMSCGSCLSTIRSELFKKQGMVDLSVNLEQGLLRVDHRPPLNEESIVRVLGEIGYPAKSVKESVNVKGGNTTTRPCSGCDSNGCSATAASWRELFRKLFGSGAP